MKSRNLNFLQPSGPLQACNGTALPLPVSALEVRNEWGYASTPHMCLRGVHVRKVAFVLVHTVQKQHQ